MNNKLRGMVLGSFLGDALALGPHWIYDVNKIKEVFGEINEFTDVPKDSYHTHKIKGDFTHYGDQTLMLLKFLSEEKEYDNKKFRDYWLHEMKTFVGYSDHATKVSIDKLSHHNEVLGSDSDDLGGLTRIAPLIYKYYDHEEKLMLSVKEETRLTHTNPLLLEIGDFLTELTLEVLKGESPESSIMKIKNSYSQSIIDMVEKAEKRIHDDPIKVISDLGQMCSCPNAFPAVVYLLLKYKHNYSQAIFANIQAGGDSAARGMVLGMVLGAYYGEEAIGSDWFKKMNTYNEINTLL